MRNFVFGRRFSASKDIRPPPGFASLGNTCYVNAALQLLLACGSFVNDVSLSSLRVGEMKSFMNWLAAEVNSNNRTSLRPHILVNYLSEASQVFERYAQNDSGELLGFMLDKLHEASRSSGGNDAKPLTHFDSDGRTSRKVSTVVSELIEKYRNANGVSVVTDWFGSMLLQSIECSSCRRLFFAVDACDSGFVVPVKKSVEESLKAHFADEDIEGYRCDSCKHVGTSRKSRFIWQAPKALMIVLNRFAFDYDYKKIKKIDGVVRYPFELDLRPYLHVSSPAAHDKSTPTEYSLKAVVLHDGSPEYGHYTASVVRRSPKGEVAWFSCNDATIRVIEPSGRGEYEPGDLLDDPRAYILLYCRNDLDEETDPNAMSD